MLFEGHNAIEGCPFIWVHVNEKGEVTRADQMRSIRPGTIALQFDEGTEVTDFVLDEELICWGVDVQAGGRAYGNRIYIRNHTGHVLRPSILGTCKVVSKPAAKKGEKAA